MPIQSVSHIRKTLCLAGLIALSVCIPTAAHAVDPGRIFAARVPDGRVRVLVLLSGPGQPLLGGLRIEDGRGAVLAARVEPDSQAQAGLDEASQSALETLRRPPAVDKANTKIARAVLMFRLISSWTFARAAGMGLELPQGVHPHAIKVVLLGADGRPARVIGSVRVHTDSGPPAPIALHAKAAPAGVTLRWQMASHSDEPVYAYVVERDFGTEKDKLTLHPRLLTTEKPGQPAPYVDSAPPVDAKIVYKLGLVDVLGVPGAPASAAVYSPDFAAGMPPGHQTAKAGRGLVTLTWTPVSNPRTRGLVVERSQLVKGPYDLLTPKGLSPRSAQYKDRNIMPGAVYYYRVRAVMPNGDLGPATDPVSAQPLSATALKAPQGLKAKAGISQVALTWDPVPGVSVAGYVVERRAAPESQWTRLNARLAPGPRYLDMVGPSAGGTFEYRVTAVATDEGVSKPSAILQVRLRDTVPPAPPILLSASGADGRVRIRFSPAPPAWKTAQVVLLRSDSPQKEGLVIGAPVPASVGGIEDNWVQGGQVYWYCLVAFNKEGDRSQESQAFEVRVGAASLPAPKAPHVEYTEQPAPEVRLTFDAPPPHVLVIVQVQAADGHWQKVAGPVAGTSAVDLNPPGPRANYRLIYVGESEGAGPPSPSAAPRRR